MSGRRKYTCNYNYFEKIDTEEKAYWLGFIFADGCMHHTKRERVLKTMTSIQERKYLTITLAEKDKEHLEKFVKAIGGTYPVNTYGGEYRYCRVVIEDEVFFQSLYDKGVVPRKTGKVEFPEISEELESHFIRGYFDGDGCLSSHISRHGTRSFEGNITSTEEMLTEIAKRLPEMGEDVKLYKRFDNNINSYTLRFGGNLKTYKIMKYLYGDSTIYLSRKYERFLELEERLREVKKTYKTQNKIKQANDIRGYLRK